MKIEKQKSLLRLWPLFLIGQDAAFLWLSVWVMALILPFLSLKASLFLAICAWLSALSLIPFRYYAKRLIIFSLIFLSLWSSIFIFIHLINDSSPFKAIINLSACLALGINLMLAKTPLSLAQALAKILKPLIGQRNAQKTALALVLLSRLLKTFLFSALEIKKTIELRIPTLSFKKKITLWTKTLLRLTFKENDELARSVLKRWPW